MTKKEMKKYFSEFFEIIPLSDVEQLWNDGDRSFSILLPDGTDKYADEYDSFEEILKEDCLFGFKKTD